MTIEEFYSLNSIQTLTLIDLYQETEVFPELSFPSNVFNPASLSNLQNQTRLQIKVIDVFARYKGFMRETKQWASCSMWLDGIPFLILLNSQRDFPFPSKYITNTSQYKIAIFYIHRLLVDEYYGESPHYVDYLNNLKIYYWQIYQSTLHLHTTSQNLKPIK